MNYLDLFSGIGGFALGAYWAGWRFDRHYFSEIDPWCCRLYQQRFPDAVPLGDITKIDGRALVQDAERNGWGSRRTEREGQWRRGASDEPSGEWVLSGGFPCQDISTAGKGAGITGTRSGLWFEYARLIGEIRPRYAIMENVGALTRRGLDRVLGSLAEIGYSAEWSDVRASDLGAPHRRERIWIVAYPQRGGCGESRKLEGLEEVSGGRADIGSETTEPSEDVAYPNEMYGQHIRGQGAGGQAQSRIGDGREDVADSDNQGPQGRDERGERSRELPAWSSGEAYTGGWESEPGVGYLVDGLSGKMDRGR